MAERLEPPIPEGPELSQKVGSREQRKLKARRHPVHPVWNGLAVLGLVGWSVALPTLAFTALGVWLDARYPGGRSWTLALLVLGLILGCVSAWVWVAQETHELREGKGDGHG
jgi:ATP synthase protein I